ncbi:malonyl-CoA synthase [Notoacmeibacter sp. MSK16QG-6]|uniref:malonate--CoA ligase n=1 Tax=Notoacmeibacter sp. MSK16QG-6 TaxID=2957982 RepID=UPI00209D3DDA|nr:malonyl-CoA synthase [Notoacmeibacter sp. MSK16QG-6]MCP1200346.1 malonyl-CoA synthase [Notoacmeibacter sp. MSK16QG-6]
MTNHLFDGLTQAGFAKPGRDFIRTAGDVRMTYSEVEAVSARYANVLIDLGVQPGDRVAVQVDKSLDALLLYLATIRAGGVFLPLNTAYTASEIEYFLTDAEPRLFVCTPAKKDALAEVAENARTAIETLGAGSNEGRVDGSLAMKADSAPAQFQTICRSGENLAAILYTSGTTGRSKGAMLTHENLLSNAETLKAYWGFSEDDVLLHALPIFHTHGLFVASNTVMLAGGSMIFLPKFDLDVVFANLPAATSMMGVPTFYTRMLDDERLNRDSTAHMRLFTSGSAPLLAETHRAFEQRTGQRILERYGMTETNMNTSNPYDSERRAGTVGFPLPNVELRITDPDSGETLPNGGIGMIEVKGPNVFKGYWRMPEKTASEFRDDGFFVTGDLGQIDEDGYVSIVGRDKDLVITGGYNVYPKEIELLIDELDGVIESAVIGVPHPDFGEGVVGVVVGKNGLEEKAILSSLEGRLARFKQPKRIVFVEELPRNTMGKVQKNVLREKFGNILSA